MFLKKQKQLKGFQWGSLVNLLMEPIGNPLKSKHVLFFQDFGFFEMIFSEIKKYCISKNYFSNPKFAQKSKNDT